LAFIPSCFSIVLSAQGIYMKLYLMIYTGILAIIPLSICRIVRIKSRLFLKGSDNDEDRN